MTFTRVAILIRRASGCDRAGNQSRLLQICRSAPRAAAQNVAPERRLRPRVDAPYRLCASEHHRCIGRLHCLASPKADSTICVRWRRVVAGPETD